MTKHLSSTAVFCVSILTTFEPGRLVGCSLVMFCLYKHRQTVLENDFLMLTRFLQVLPAFCHAGQVKTFEVLKDLIFHVC